MMIRRGKMFPGRPAKPICAAFIVAVYLVGSTTLLVAPPTEAATATNQSEAIKLKSALKLVEPCMLDAVFSFLYPRSNFPTTKEALAATCKRQSDAFRCIKDKSKTTPALIRRGLASVVSSRQRVNKKFCTNLSSEQSQRFLADFKCIIEKRFSHFKAIDTEFSNTIDEIERRNYKDSALELKQFCCANYKYRRESIEGHGKECPTARQTMQEIISSEIPNDISFICEDDEKMAKTCAELEPIKVSSEFDTSKPSPAITGLYLVATLGEAS